MLALVLLILPGVLRAATDEPRLIAEAVLQAWRDSDAAALNRLSHPDLKKKLRTSRLLVFHLDQKNESSDVSALSDDKVVQLFCEAHKAVAPRDGRVEYFDEYLSTENRGGFAVVVFDSGWRSKTSAQTQRMRNEIVLKRAGDRWLFLWSSAMSVHVDLEWDARTEIPNLATPR